MTSQFEEGKGRAKEEIGEATGDERLEREGKADQAAAKAKEAVDSGKQGLNKLIDSIKERFRRR